MAARRRVLIREAPPYGAHPRSCHKPIHPGMATHDVPARLNDSAKGAVCAEPLPVSLDRRHYQRAPPKHQTWHFTRRTARIIEPFLVVALNHESERKPAECEAQVGTNRIQA